MPEMTSCVLKKWSASWEMLLDFALRRLDCKGRLELVVWPIMPTLRIFVQIQQRAEEAGSHLR